MAKIKKDRMGSLSGMKASDKRVGPVDPQGAWTKIQEATLADARMKATLKKDKELGATKMKSGGKMGRSEKSYGLDRRLQLIKKSTQLVSEKLL